MSSLAAASAGQCRGGARGSGKRLRLPALRPARRYGQDITDKNLPQEVNRDQYAVNFTKGCYLGQETVARIEPRLARQPRACGRTVYRYGSSAAGNGDKGRRCHDARCTRDWRRDFERLFATVRLQSACRWRTFAVGIPAWGQSLCRRTVPLRLLRCRCDWKQLAVSG